MATEVQGAAVALRNFRIGGENEAAGAAVATAVAVEEFCGRDRV